MARPTKREQTNKKIAAALSKMTDKVLDRLRQAFSIGATIEEAAFYAGVHPSTYYDWKKNNPKLDEEMAALRQRPILRARQTVVKALDTDHNHAFRYLERKRPEEFGPTSKIQQTVEISDSPTEAMGEEEIVALAALREARRRRINREIKEASV